MKYELETRTCKCGCGLTWRCLNTSKNLYVRSSHGPNPRLPFKDSIVYGYRSKKQVFEKDKEQAKGTSEDDVKD